MNSALAVRGNVMTCKGVFILTFVVVSLGLPRRTTLGVCAFD